MELQEKHRITLLNAKCEYVCKAQEALKKSQYGEDITCCIENLWLASKLINRLDCYCFPEASLETTDTGVFSLTSGDESPLADGVYTLYNGSTLLAIFTASSNTEKEVYLSLLNDSGLDYSGVVTGVGQTRYDVKVDCSISVLSVYQDGVSFVDFDVTTMPTCETVLSECFNCIEDSDLNKMYEVLSDLLK